MSTPTVPPASPNNPTRQLLDELDALMERMLSLPVEEVDGAEPLPPPRSPLLREPAAPVIVSIGSPPSLANRGELIQTVGASPTIRPPARPAPTTSAAPAPPPTAAATTTSPPPISAAPHWSPKGILERTLPSRPLEVRLAWWMPPILWSNRVFDRATLRLGPVGRWLRGETGRTLLGWSGLVLLVLALTCLVLDIVGWSW
jgi:hypothetical protein